MMCVDASVWNFECPMLFWLVLMFKNREGVS